MPSWELHNFRNSSSDLQLGFIKAKQVVCESDPVIGRVFQTLWSACRRLSELNSWQVFALSIYCLFQNQ